MNVFEYFISSDFPVVNAERYKFTMKIPFYGTEETMNTSIDT